MCNSVEWYMRYQVIFDEECFDKAKNGSEAIIFVKRKSKCTIARDFSWRINSNLLLILKDYHPNILVNNIGLFLY